ncbi:MAG: winged helix DNA-binding protein [Novosphingobium sp.]
MDEISDSPTESPAANNNQWDDANLGDLARKAYAVRRRRESIPGTAGLFGEPAWDILLDLFIAARESRRVSLATACTAAAVPEASAQRWIAILERRGLVVVEGPAHDRRLKLSQVTYENLIAYFRRL